jgi:hypothetical protein
MSGDDYNLHFAPLVSDARSVAAHPAGDPCWASRGRRGPSPGGLPKKAKKAKNAKNAKNVS